LKTVKVSASLTKLKQTQKDFKKINTELKKALKKVKKLEEENADLLNELENKQNDKK